MQDGIGPGSQAAAATPSRVRGKGRCQASCRNCDQETEGSESTDVAAHGTSIPAHGLAQRSQLSRGHGVIPLRNSREVLAADDAHAVLDAQALAEVQHVSLASDDGAIARDELRPSIDPPGGPSARPDDLDDLARGHRNDDQVVVGGGDADRPDECRRAEKGARLIRRFGGEVQASSARRERWTDPKRTEHHYGCGKEDDDPHRNDQRLSSTHQSILILRSTLAVSPGALAQRFRMSADQPKP